MPPCWPRLDPRPWRDSKNASGNPTRHDPLILDLDGDGIETISIYDGTYFDHNGDGFAEATGWVAFDDGILALDINGDGLILEDKELFGNETILKDGTKAAGGFQALAALDKNQDGKIDASDKAFSELRVIKGYDQNGWQIYTLDELGIRSINLDSVIAHSSDLQGNLQLRVGSFQWSDGATGKVAEYRFATDRSYAVPYVWYAVPEDIAALPNLAGNGNVYDLDQAMVRDTSGQLLSLVEQFISANDPGCRNTVMEQILFKWAGTARIPQEISISGQFVAASASASIPTYSGAAAVSLGVDLMDSRRLGVLEHWFGEPWAGISGPNPNYAASVLLNEAYREVFEVTYAELMAQTHLKGLYDKVVHSWDEEKQQAKTDFSDVIPEIVAELNNDPAQGRQTLSEFTRMLRGLSSCSPACYLTFREHMIEFDPTLASVFDSGGLPVYDQLHQGTRVVTAYGGDRQCRFCSWQPHPGRPLHQRPCRKRCNLRYVPKRGPY